MVACREVGKRRAEARKKMLDVHGAFEEDEYEKEEKEREKRVEKMNEEVEGEKNVIYSLLKERL